MSFHSTEVFTRILLTIILLGSFNISKPLMRVFLSRLHYHKPNFLIRVPILQNFPSLVSIFIYAFANIRSLNLGISPLYRESLTFAQAETKRLKSDSYQLLSRDLIKSLISFNSLFNSSTFSSNVSVLSCTIVSTSTASTKDKPKIPPTINKATK